MTDNDDPDGPDLSGFASEERRALARLMALPPGYRRALPDPDNPYRPQLHLFARIASMRQAVERIERNSIAVADADELTHADIGLILLRGGRLVPRGITHRRSTSGFVVLADRRGPSTVFLEASRYPLRAPLSIPHARRLATRLRRATAEDVEASTGPLIDDPSWQGIGLERRLSWVDVRLRAIGFTRDVTLEADDATYLAQLLGQVVDAGPRR